jgi:L-arabinokinase
MLIAYVSGHGFGHATRLCAVLRAVRALAPSLPITLAGEVPETLFREAVPGPSAFRRVACDVGLAQRNALEIDEPATAQRCRDFEASWEERVSSEAAFLRERGARLVVGDIPPLAFAAAARAGIPSFALGNFSWDWIYRHLASRQPSLAASAERAAQAYAGADLLLELPFAGDLSAFRRRLQVGLVARRPRVDRLEARRRLGLDSGPVVLVSFGGLGLPWLTPEVLSQNAGLHFLVPADLTAQRLLALGLGYPDVVGAADVVLTKPGYGIVSDAIGAGTRVVYSDRGDFPEYPILVREMRNYLACVHIPSEELRAGRLSDPIHRVLHLAVPAPPDLGGAERAAARVLEALG